MLNAGYADTVKICNDAFQLLAPPERISTADFAARHRFLNNGSGGYTGPWSNSVAHYLGGIMDAIDSPTISCIAIAGPGQSGKTECAQNYLFRTIVNSPADILWFMQTNEGLMSFVKARIDRMIEQHEILRSRLGKKPIDDSVHYKKFRGMRCEFLSATHSNLINKAAGRIIADEIDAYASLGDIKGLLDVRRQSYGAASKLILLSHPDLATGLDPSQWTAGIMSNFRDSDRRVWWWPCQHCHGWSSPCPIAPRYMELKLPDDVAAPLDEVERSAALLCPTCGVLIPDGERRLMNAAGKWVSLYQDVAEDGTVTGEPPRNTTAGFWITGTMSPFLLTGIGGLARALAKGLADLDTAGDDSTLRQVIIKQCGFPYSPPKGSRGSISSVSLAERAERTPQGIVPPGVRFLTAGADIQAGRIELLIRGWGIKGESWIVDRHILTGDPTTDPRLWDQAMAVAMKGRKISDNSGRLMRPRCFVFDSGGQPGVAQQAYDAFKRWRRQGVARLLTQVDGRDAWNMLPSKGASTIGATRLKLSYPDSQRADRDARTGGSTPLLQFNTNLAKDELMRELSTEPGEPWSIHIPRWLCGDSPPFRIIEQMTDSERRLPTGRWERIPGVKNELLDLMILCWAGALLHGLHHINWDRPPAWAGPWNSENPLISEAVKEPTPVLKVGEATPKKKTLASMLP